MSFREQQCMNRPKNRSNAQDMRKVGNSTQRWSLYIQNLNSQFFYACHQSIITPIVLWISGLLILSTTYLHFKKQHEIFNVIEMLTRRETKNWIVSIVIPCARLTLLSWKGIISIMFVVNQMVTSFPQACLWPVWFRISVKEVLTCWALQKNGRGREMGGPNGTSESDKASCLVYIQKITWSLNCKRKEMDMLD